MTAIIRRADPADAEAIITLINALAAFVEATPTCLTPDDIRRDGFGSDAWFQCWVAEQDGEALGYAIAYPGFNTEHGGRGLHLADLYVDAALRGQGLGRALMAAVARHGCERGARWMAWDIWVENETAKAFYTAMDADPCDDIRTMILKGQALAALASERH